MSTYNEVISRVQNGLNSLTKDMRIPKRYILAVLKETGTFLLSQKMRDKSIYRETDLFTWLHCVELKNIDVIKCPVFEFRRCNSVMRSKKKLPKIIGSKYGYAVLMVTSVDGENTLSVTSLMEFTSLRNRKDYKKFAGNFFYISDDYLYAPDSEIELVDVLALTIDEDHEECSSCKDSKCKSAYEIDFPLPESVANSVVQETIREISLRLGVQRDENGNLDQNILSQSIQ